MAIFVVLPWLPPILQFDPICRVNYKMSYLCNHRVDLDNSYVHYYVFTYPRRL